MTIDASLHNARDRLTCVHSTDAAPAGTQVTVEPRNGLAVSLTVPPAGLVIYR